MSRGVSTLRGADGGFSVGRVNGGRGSDRFAPRRAGGTTASIWVTAQPFLHTGHLWRVRLATVTGVLKAGRGGCVYEGLQFGHHFVLFSSFDGRRNFTRAIRIGDSRTQ